MPRLFTVLLVEDNPIDTELAREAFGATPGSIELECVRTGEEALGFLRREGRFLSAPRPGLVLLDLGLPGMDGRRVLGAIKQDPQLRRTPVVVFSSSASDEEVGSAYDLHANAYVRKPIDMGHYSRLMDLLKTFWVDAVSLPVVADAAA